LAPGSGRDTIFDFQVGAYVFVGDTIYGLSGHDRIDVSAYGITHFEQLRTDGNVVDLGASAGGPAGVDIVTIYFSSGNMAGLTKEDFIFAA
jgi:hypothetical protein